MTHFVKLENGVPQPGIIIEENLRQAIPALSLVQIFTPEIVEPHGYGIYDFSSQPTLGRYEKAIEALPVRDARGIWMQTWSVQPMTAEEVAETDRHQADAMRGKRNFLLNRSDWTQLGDAPLTPEQKAVWTTYRQQLRDITAQAGFPWEVTWPSISNTNQ